MANRNTLHINKLDDFKKWLLSDGWEILDTKGDYEIIRAIKDKRLLSGYKKLEAKEHISLLDRDMDIVRAYLKARKETKQ